MNKASGAVIIEDSGSEDGSDNDGNEGVDLPYHKSAELCEQLEKAWVIHCDADGVLVLALQNQLRKLQAHFHHLEFASLKQTSLDTSLHSN
jgi:hypothetical protein